MRKTPWYYFNIAAERATKRTEERRYYLAALAVRSDGTIVTTTNGKAYGPNPHSHAEKRLMRKVDKGAVVFVCRVGATGEFRLSRPCPNCLYSMKNKDVSRVYYTISPEEYGVIDL